MKIGNLLFIFFLCIARCQALAAQVEPIPPPMSDEEYEKTKFLIFTQAGEIGIPVRDARVRLIESLVPQAAMREDGQTLAALFWEGQGNVFLFTIETIRLKLDPNLKAKILLTVLPDDGLWTFLGPENYKRYGGKVQSQVLWVLTSEVNKLLNENYTPTLLQDAETRKAVAERVRLKLAEMATGSNQPGIVPIINSPREKGPAEYSETKSAAQEKPQTSVALPVDKATKPSSSHFPIVPATIITVLIIGVIVFMMRGNP